MAHGGYKTDCRRGGMELNFIELYFLINPAFDRRRARFHQSWHLTNLPPIKSLNFSPFTLHEPLGRKHRFAEGCVFFSALS